MVIFAYLTWASITGSGEVFTSGRCCTQPSRIPKVWLWDGGRAGEELKQAMILTSRLKSANSPNKIFKILEAEMDTQIFDEIHASSAYHSLAVFRKKGSLKWKNNSAQLAQDRPLAEALATKIQEMMAEGRFAPRTAANLLWSVAQLPQEFRSSKGFVAALVELISQQAQGMKAQELSSSLWACARLQAELLSKSVGPVCVLLGFEQWLFGRSGWIWMDDFLASTFFEPTPTSS